jgi:hypothetical protein
MHEFGFSTLCVLGVLCGSKLPGLVVVRVDRIGRHSETRIKA